jgi:5-methylcytosine-specific restriction endonuclease McrA
MPTIKQKCKICGIEFIGNGNNSKYCIPCKTFHCIWCKREFVVGGDRIKNCPNRFCSKSCSAKYTISIKDKEVWRKHLSECGKIGGNSPKKSRNVSDEMMSSLRERMTGDKNPNWNGGVAKLKRYKHYNNSEYRNWRNSVFGRDNYTCQVCGKNNCFLHPHHIRSYTNYPELRYDTDNGLTLCVPCHKIEHSKH